MSRNPHPQGDDQGCGNTSRTSHNARWSWPQHQERHWRISASAHRKKWRLWDSGSRSHLRLNRNSVKEAGYTDGSGKHP
jgi:hypothetical protein